MQRPMSLAMVAFIGSAALIAGCGSSSSSNGSGGNKTGGSGSNNSSQTPAAELTSAVSALGKASTLTTSIKLGANASQISQLAQSLHKTLTSAQANAIAGAQISVEVAAPSGKTLGALTGSDASGSAVDFTVSDNGTNFISLRSVSKTLYIQVDLKDLLTAIGETSAYQSLSAESAQLPSFIQALFQGKWVSLPESAAKSLTGSLGATGGASANPAQEQQFIAGLKTILTKDVTVTRTSSGGTDVLALSANSRTIATDLISTLSSAVPSAAGALGSANASNVPSQNIALSAQVAGGALSQLSIDVGQFDKKQKISLPIDVNFTESGPSIGAPSGAVPVDTAQLGALFGGLTGGSAG
jgi:hypothetical protein